MFFLLSNKVFFDFFALLFNDCRCFVTISWLVHCFALLQNQFVGNRFEFLFDLNRDCFTLCISVFMSCSACGSLESLSRSSDDSESEGGWGCDYRLGGNC